MTRKQVDNIDLLKRLSSFLSWTVFFTVVATLGLLFYGFWGEELLSDFHDEKKSSKELMDRRAAERAMELAEKNWDRVENGIHLRTGLAFDEDFQLVNAVCTACHSAKLVTQNRATADGWSEMIRWMQATQGLQDLGSDEVTIVRYLSKHYAPEQAGRRTMIDPEKVEWYDLEL